jgi:1,4-alpha-glucan branching enzyme
VSRRPGALALVLHSHMPYVEGFDRWPFGEEWLWEAVACVYLPLLELLGGAPVTVGLTPVLCDQLETMRGDAGERYLSFLRDIRAPIHEMDAAELERGGERKAAAELRRAAGDYVRAGEEFERRARDPLGAFAALEGVELWTSAATHALLPLLATDAGLGLQLATGVGSHQRRFGRWGGGLWLPECAYAPGLERELADHGVRVFCVDQTAVHGLGAPEQLEPVTTQAGPVAVPIDWQTVELVWHERDGYPTADAYRDYHRRTGHDLRPWDNAGRPYDREAAMRLAREHARDFLARVAVRLEGGGLLCCAFDTELLGHWWYEGQAWLRGVLEEAAREGVELVTVSEGLERLGPGSARVPVVREGPGSARTGAIAVVREGPGSARTGAISLRRALAPSSWGSGKDLSTWDAPAVAELAFAARRAELRTVAAAASRHQPRAALERAARELLALQASDWAFLITRELAGDYPHRRVEAHLAGHEAALTALSSPAALRNLAPDLDLASLTTP